MKLVQFLLLIDDSLVIFLVTLLGIRFHQTDLAFFSRLPYTFLPFLVAWLSFAAVLRLYDSATASALSQVWRVPVAAFLAAPIGAAARALWLGTPLIPIFVLVMGAAISVGILISRGAFILAFASNWSKTEKWKKSN